MALEKNHQNKPLLPRLASAKPPITPRLAVQNSRASPSPSARSAASARTDASRNRPVLSPPSRNDLSTPVKTILNSNVTPRSSLRKSRIEGSLSGHSTPNSTPTSTPTDRQPPNPTWNAESSNRAQSPFHTRPKSVVVGNNGPAGSKSPLARATTFAAAKSASTSPRDASTSSSFFHASDAKSIPPPAQPTKKQASFFYADGSKDHSEPARSARNPSPPLSTLSTHSHKSQFYHADGQPEAVPPLPLSPALSDHHGPRPIITRTDSASSNPARPPSPQKTGLHLTYRKGASQILSPKNRSAAFPMLPTVPQNPPSPRSASHNIESNTPLPPKHSRAGSLSSIDTNASSRKSSISGIDSQLRHALHGRLSPTSAPSAPRLPPPTSNPTLADAPSLPPHSHSNSITSLPSPTHKVPAHFAEAAANARRERKVLDLEISNSSLLAINRQLEREVRRQKAELRRFRRLSRAGRLSSLPNMLHEDDADGSSRRATISDVDSGSESDYLDDDDPESSFSEESFASGTLSPSTLATRDASRLAKDEKRLKLDLDRHRQLLVDSQKMNQSLKRCCAWAEDMIAEGRRALAYTVRVSDIKLGGRVLDRDDLNGGNAELASSPPGEDGLYEVEDDEPETRQGLLGSWSPPEGQTPLGALMSATDGLLGLAVGMEEDASPGWSSVQGERDSGVEIVEGAIKEMSVT